MRIISKFKDYYDSCGGEHQWCATKDGNYVYNNTSEEDHIWTRNSNEDGNPKNMIWINPSTNKHFTNTEIPAFGDLKIYCKNRSIGNNIELTLGVLVFCDQIYPLWMIEDWYHRYRRDGQALVVGYDQDSLYNFLNTVKDEYQIADYCLNRDSCWGVGQYTSKLFDKNYMAKYHDQLVQLLFDYKVPYMLITFDINRNDANHYNHKFYHNHRANIVLNPNLKTLQFNTILDPHSCYQQIETFLFNQLFTIEKPIPEISDNLKAESKGFNKWSFRKEPTKKK